jgi:hypothetical protein
MQALELQRVDERTLELHAARSWSATAFDRIGPPMRVGTRVVLPAFTVEVREVDASGAPTRARFTFERALEDPALSFWLWERSKVVRWKPLAIGRRAELPKSSTF